MFRVWGKLISLKTACQKREFVQKNYSEDNFTEVAAAAAKK